MAVKLFTCVVFVRSSYFPEQFHWHACFVFLQFSEWRRHFVASRNSRHVSLSHHFRILKTRPDDTASAVSLLIYSERAAITVAPPVIANTTILSAVRWECLLKAYFCAATHSALLRSTHSRLRCLLFRHRTGLWEQKSKSKHVRNPQVLQTVNLLFSLGACLSLHTNTCVALTSSLHGLRMELFWRWEKCMTINLRPVLWELHSRQGKVTQMLVVWVITPCRIS